jgi:hypothetical protein
VRLDEWQKFIESQFLDDAPKVPPKQADRKQTTHDGQPTQQATLPLSSSTSGHAAFAPVADIDVDIPSFEHYLPASHTSANENVVSPAPTDLTDKDPANGLEGRRVPLSRARHARNVRPENVPSGLSAAELWAQVPKHVQSLLALERIDAEKEIAQFSYKRPFQEKRHELIGRLLDPILSLEDTARLLNVCPTTVRRYTNKGILTYYRKEPDRPSNRSASKKETRQRRFRLSDILAFLETQQSAIEADRRAEQSAAMRKQNRETEMHREEVVGTKADPLSSSEQASPPGEAG